MGAEDSRKVQVQTSRAGASRFDPVDNPLQTRPLFKGQTDLLLQQAVSDQAQNSGLHLQPDHYGCDRRQRLRLGGAQPQDNSGAQPQNTCGVYRLDVGLHDPGLYFGHQVLYAVRFLSR